MHQHLPSPVTFREDINGLRAWAVIAVLLFHFSLIGLPGGFAGVDVFFVISGYLMTAIIVVGYEKGNFSIGKFYMARARRILPALMVVIVTLLALGWFWLPTPDYQELGKQSAYSLAFLSNIGYWRSAGYFDAAAQEKWLLHTWSLAVEAQFYVLYPLFVALMWRFFKDLKALTIGLGLLFGVSLALNLVVTFWKPTAAFYLLPTRGWELAAGGVVYLIATQGWIAQGLKEKGFWLGWALILGSFAFIEEGFAWPGYWAILPVLGAILIILGQRENCFLTDNRLAQWLGDRSYSLYLWHWPLVVALYFAGLQNDWTWVATAFALSLLLAHLSYRLVEVPTRQYLSRAKLVKEILAIGAAGLVIGLAAVTVKLLTLDFRAINQTEEGKYLSYYSRDHYVPLIKEDYLEKCNFFDGDTYTAKTSEIDSSCTQKNSEGGIFIWGDSHAQALSHGVRELLKNNYPTTPFYQVASSGCRAHLEPDTQTSGEFKKSCDRSNKYALKAIAELQPKVVVIAQRDKHDQNDFLSIAGKLKNLGVSQVIVIGPVPQWQPSLPQAIAKRHWSDGAYIDDPTFDVDLQVIDHKLKNLFLTQDQLTYVSVQDQLCNHSSCLAKLDEKHTPLVFDYGHLTPQGSVYVVNKVLKPHLEKALSE